MSARRLDPSDGMYLVAGVCFLIAVHYFIPRFLSVPLLVLFEGLWITGFLAWVRAVGVDADATMRVPRRRRLGRVVAAPPAPLPSERDGTAAKGFASPQAIVGFGLMLTGVASIVALILQG